MIKPFSLEQLMAIKELIPQAILDVSLDDVAKKHGFEVEKGHDELDYYSGIGATTESFQFALMHYHGYPEHTSTIYLPKDLGSDVKSITDTVHSIAQALNLDDKFIWERKKDPDL